MTIPKFRAWLKEEHKMTDVREMTFMYDEVYLIEDVTGFYAYEEFKLMQSTGLFDENGKEIFDGDILHTPDNELAKVFWNDDLAGWFVDFLYEIAELSDVADIQSSRSICNIIGNIYENPELLEGEK